MAKVSLSSPVTRPKASRLAIWAAMIVIYIVWGSTYLSIRFAVETIPPFFLAAARFLTAGGVLFGIRRLAGDPLPRRIEMRSAAIIGLFLLLGGNGSVTWAEQTVPSGMAALMVSSAPLWMLMMETLLPGGRRPPLRALLGIIVGFTGVLLLLWPGESGGLLKLNPAGAAALIFATLAWSFGSIYTRNAELPSSPLMGTAIEMLAGGFALALVGILTGEITRLDLPGISLKSLLGLGYLIVFGALVGFSAYTWLLRVAPISLVSTYAYVNPLVALLVGALLGNESFSTRTLVAAGVILGAVALITTAGRSQNTQQVETASAADMANPRTKQ